MTNQPTHLFADAQLREIANLREIARRECGAGRTGCPVRIVRGNQAPVRHGEGGHWTTPSGEPVRYPSAYSRAFGRPVYHRSTIRVTVGARWLAARGTLTATELRMYEISTDAARMAAA